MKFTKPKILKPTVIPPIDFDRHTYDKKYVRTKGGFK